MLDDVDALTPIERHGALLYKRDDLFVPFDDVPLSGGKVRQAMLLLEHARDEIVERFDSYVLTATGVHSPQGLIIARVAAGLDLDCVIFVGATTVGGALMRHSMLRRAVATGATLDARARVAYEPALMKAAEHWQRDHNGAGYLVRFGINLEGDSDAIIASTARQVRNVPRSVEVIVVPTGAGITAAGVIIGAAEYAPQATVIVVQIAGYNRRELIERVVGELDYDYEAIKQHPYSKHLERSVDGITLDPVYEAKAHDWLLEQPELCNEHTLFWLVGDSTAVRQEGGQHGAHRSAAKAVA